MKQPAHRVILKILAEDIVRFHEAQSPQANIASASAVETLMEVIGHMVIPAGELDEVLEKLRQIRNSTPQFRSELDQLIVDLMGERTPAGCER